VDFTLAKNCYVSVFGNADAKEWKLLESKAGVVESREGKFDNEGGVNATKNATRGLIEHATVILDVRK